MNVALLMRCGLLLQVLEGWTPIPVLIERFLGGRAATQAAVLWLVEHGYADLADDVARWLPHRDFCELWAEHFDRPCPITTTSRTTAGSPLNEVDHAVGN